MKKILIFITIFLSGAWAYTSWYWYTCEVKDACSSPNHQNGLLQDTRDDINMTDELALSTGGVMIEEEYGDEYVIESINDADEQINEVQNLNSNDVTSPSPIIPPQAVIIEEEEEDSIDDSFLIPEQEDDIPQDISNDMGATQEQGGSSSISITSICQDPLVGPLSLGANNNPDEVLILEQFLMERGFLSSSDGVFGDDVFEAVKAFQEEFRDEILMPWGINNPTGYVGRTTIQKIQELACN